MTKKKRKRRRRLRVGRLLLLLMIPVLIAAAILFFSYRNSLKPIQKESEIVTVTIPDGSSVKSAVEILKNEGLIRNKDFVYFYVRQNKLTNIKSGTYDLDKSWDVKTIFEHLSDSSNAAVDSVTVTIIEGDWAKHAAAKIAEATNVSAEEAAKMAGVGIDFVVQSAKQKAGNQYGRVATMSGFYFYIAGSTPVCEGGTGTPPTVKEAIKPVKKPKRKGSTDDYLWRLNIDRLLAWCDRKGIESIPQLSRICGINPGCIYGYAKPPGAAGRPEVSVALAKVCLELGCTFDELFDKYENKGE